MVSDDSCGPPRACGSGLNPCSNGIWSLTGRFWAERNKGKSLNPCSNGIWSLTRQDVLREDDVSVLILVLMEYGLWPYSSSCIRSCRPCLNPCSNGIWSLTFPSPNLENSSTILNPGSNGIWSLTVCFWIFEWRFDSLNPCSNGIWSLTTWRMTWPRSCSS